MGLRFLDATAAAGPQASPADREAVVWHDLECGGYTADLPLWRELAALAGIGADSGWILDVGCGTGRVALDLARRGHRVIALDRDPRLLCALGERAEGLTLETVCADARSFELGRDDVAVCLAPQQTIQLLGGREPRLAFLRRARSHLRPGGLLACAIVTEIDTFDGARGDPLPSAEATHVEGTDYLSRATRVHARGGVIRIERERLISPSSRAHPSMPLLRSEQDTIELDQLSLRELRREGRTAGLRSLPRRSIAASDIYVGSEIALFSA